MIILLFLKTLIWFQFCHVIHSLIHIFLQKKLGFFTSAEDFRYIQLNENHFLQIQKLFDNMIALWLAHAIVDLKTHFVIVTWVFYDIVP